MLAEDKLEEIVGDLGLDVDTANLEDYDLQTEPAEEDIAKTLYELSAIEPVEPGQENTHNIEQDILLNDGSQLTILVKRRPQCPNCGYTLAEEEDGKHLLNSHGVCPRCMVRCTSCNEIMADTESKGHRDQAYCDDCWEQVDQEIQHEHEMDRREKQLQELRLQLEHQQKKERMEMEQRQKQWDKRVEAMRLKMEAAKMVNQVKDPEQIQQERRLPGSFQDVPSRFKNIEETSDRFKR